MDLNLLESYAYPDTKKLRIVEMAAQPPVMMAADFNDIGESLYLKSPMADVKIELTKKCPKCGRKYPSHEIFCMDCLERLQDFDAVRISEISLDPSFDIQGERQFREFEEILSDENLLKIAQNTFSLNSIVLNIKKTAFRRLQDSVKKYDIDFDSLSVLDKVILFTKSFVDVEYKSYGQELGVYRFNRIYIDDRQLDALQITTLLHELTHFLIKEIMTQVLCEIWDCSKNTLIESLATFIMSYSPITGLVDEYAAHTVEGRFTLYGYQDYSSFLAIQDSIELDRQDIEMLKTIGNTFADTIKAMLESFIDNDLLEDIKECFRKQILDSPDYRNLAYENCTLLNAEGMNQAVRFLLSDGFEAAKDNIPKLESYNEMWP